MGSLYLLFTFAFFLFFGWIFSRHGGGIPDAIAMLLLLALGFVGSIICSVAFIIIFFGSGY